MNTSLAINGLAEFGLSVNVVDNTIGADSAKINSACEKLDACVTSMEQFIEELTEQQNAILHDWEGEAADTLREYFPKVIEEFRAVPKSVKSISDWAATTNKSLMSSDSALADSLKKFLGGVN